MSWTGRNACPYYAILLASIAIAGAQEKGQDKSRFEPRPVADYAARQSVSRVTIAVEPFESGEKVKRAFGKSDPAKNGVVPIFVLIANDSDRVVELDKIRVQLITADRQTLDSISAEDVQRSGRMKAPDLGGQRPSPIPGIRRGPKKPKEEWEIAAREFVAPVVEPGDKASGFFYFRTVPGRLAGAKAYITGLRDARTGQDLLYFEIPLDDSLKGR